MIDRTLVSACLPSIIQLLGDCPTQLEKNWLAECHHIFDGDQLRAKPWTLHAWTQDTRMDTIWIVKSSIFSSKELCDAFIEAVCRRDVCIMSCFADEAHFAFESAHPTKYHRFVLPESIDAN